LQLTSNKIAKRNLIVLCFLLFESVIVLGGCASPKLVVCEKRVRFAEPNKIEFNDNEKLLLCGDVSKESWTEIPPAQAEYMLRDLLKQRGYYSPNFSYRNDMLTVDPGPLKRVSSLTFKGEPTGFSDVKIRNVLGAALTSSALNQVEDFTTSRLKNMGFACPDVKIRASDVSGAINVTIKTGAPYFFSDPVVAESLGLYPRTMRRFDAFQIHDPYHYEWLKLSSNRAENDGIVVSSQFDLKCPNPTLVQHLMGGDRHLLTVGAGISTEEFPIVELTLKSVRLSDLGTNLQTSLHLSQRIQKLNAIFTDYVFKNAPRVDFAPTFTVDHDTEPSYSFTQFQTVVPLEYRADTQSEAWLFSLGPAINRQYSVDYASLIPESYFSLVGHINLMAHQYELYETDPRGGSTEDLNIQIISNQISATPLAFVYRFTGSNLLQLNAVEPPQWILGFRYGLATTVSEQRPESSTLLPPQYFNTLGGDQNLRGFGRNELAQGTVGAMTSVFLSSEIRYAKSWAYGIEPFLFFDMGALGDLPFDLQSVLYYSPGLGIRWSTPFGSIRGTFSHGYISKEESEQNDVQHFQAFFSFGKEF